jgi:hypothetical protein
MNGLGLGQAGLLRERETKAETRAERRRAFMRRQFDASPTPEQTKFDIFFGVFFPVVCFILDPLVFKNFGGVGGGGLFADYQLFTYALAAFEMTALGVWLFARGRLGEWAAAAGGVMLAGALFCFVLGVVLLPFSFLGLLLLIGALGFMPFLTGFVYLRNGVRAVRLARNPLSFRANFVGSLVVGAALAFGLPALAGAGVSRFVNSSVETLLAGRELSELERSALRVATNFTNAPFDQLALAYESETDPARKARLAAVYRDLTGGDVQRRLYILRD